MSTPTNQASEPSGGKRKKGRLKFSPMKILVIESSGQYYRTLAYALGLGISHLMIGAIVITVLINYLHTTPNMHAVFCTIGHQIFMAQGIACLSHVNGWSSHLKHKHRIVVHVIFSLCAVVSIVYGTIIMLSNRGLTSTVHSISGFIAYFFLILCLFVGPLTLLDLSCTTSVHKLLGLCSLSSCSVCLCTGFYTNLFKTWAHDNIVYLLTFFVIFSTSCIVVHSLTRLTMQLHKFRD